MKQSQALARLRAELILEVHGGRISAKEAANKLNVSRKTYYKWERRALRAMVEALESRTAGRPGQRLDQEKEALIKEKSELERRLKMAEAVFELRQNFASLSPPRAIKGSGSAKKRTR
jgi:transposase